MTSIITCQIIITKLREKYSGSLRFTYEHSILLEAAKHVIGHLTFAFSHHMTDKSTNVAIKQMTNPAMSPYIKLKLYHFSSYCEEN